jgi:hypothetical protein
LNFLEWLLMPISNQLNRIEGKLDKLMTSSQDAVDRITAQLAKATSEITTEIDNLKAAVAAGQAPDFTALEAAAQTLDDIVPDAPEEPPAE